MQNNIIFSTEGSLLNLSTGTAAGNSVAAAQSGTITSRLPILRSSHQQ